MKTTLSILCLLFIGQTKAQRLIKEFFPGKDNCFINYMGNLDAGFVFASYTTEHGLEPWISDGTENGTRLIKDIFPGQNSSIVTDFAYEADSIIYFIAQASDHYQFWCTDGTSNGTFKLFDLGIDIPSKFYNQAIVYNGKLYFINLNNKNSSLMSTDGTVAGTKQVYQFRDSGLQRPFGLNEWQGQIYFFAGDEAHGMEFWTSDGTTTGTYMLKDIYPGPNSSIYPRQIIMAGNKHRLFFQASSSQEVGYELFTSDGTSDGTQLFKDFAPEKNVSSNPTIVKGNDSFFIINTTVKTWKSDGTVQNTSEFYKDPDDSLGYSFAYNITEYNNRYIVSLYTDQTGTELYNYDKKTNQLSLIKDINPGVAGSGGGQLFPKGGKLYFWAQNNMLGADIWVTDGSFDNTIVFRETPIHQGNEILFTWKNRMFFVGIFDVLVGSELYEITFNATGLKKTDSPAFNIYPNPVKTGTSLHIPEEESTITLFNIHGQKVWHTTASNGKIQIPDYLSKGIYTIRITTSDQETHHKIVIEQD